MNKSRKKSPSPRTIVSQIHQLKTGLLTVASKLNFWFLSTRMNKEKLLYFVPL